MPHVYHRFWTCHKTLLFCTLLAGQSLAPATQNHILTSKSGPRPSVFCTFTSTCAWRHNGVHFFNMSTSKSAPTLLLSFWLPNALRAATARTFSTSEVSKVFRTWFVFSMFTSECASRHNAVHFSNISTSKSAPTLKCFYHFDFQMCFRPQRRVRFQHLNFQKCSETEVLLTFWLWNVLRHNGVQFFISHLLRRFARAALASLLFYPPEPQNIGKAQCFATLSLLSDLLPSHFLFSDSSHLCFSICPNCRKFDF